MLLACMGMLTRKLCQCPHGWGCICIYYWQAQVSWSLPGNHNRMGSCPITASICHAKPHMFEWHSKYHNIPREWGSQSYFQPILAPLWLTQHLPALLSHGTVHKIKPLIRVQLSVQLLPPYCSDSSPWSSCTVAVFTWIAAVTHFYLLKWPASPGSAGESPS